MAGMVWVTLGGVAVLVILAVIVAARNMGDTTGGDLGIISSSWLNERRANDRESDHNR